jgi:hypothetical protein
MSRFAHYQNQSDKYRLWTDYFEGSLEIRSDYYEQLSESERQSSYLNIRFGFRGRARGELAVAAWLPDFERCPESERRKWQAFHLQDEVFPEESDPRFGLWVRRYIHGDWEVDNGVLSQVSAEIATINAIVEVVVGQHLYEFHENPALIFPTAENDHRYQDAHKEAYSYLIDGLRKPAIEALARQLGVAVKLANDKTLAGLKKILPSDLQKSILVPFEVVSEQRRLASHRTRPPAKPFTAFEKFSKDMGGVLGALRALRVFLEGEFSVTGEQCETRQARIAALPKIDDTRKPQPNYSICQLPQIVGKAIQKVEFGFHKSTPKVHQSEAMILHFTDGSMLGVTTGSNAWNVSGEHEGLRPEDFHVDFVLTFVPPVK